MNAISVAILVGGIVAAAIMAKDDPIFLVMYLFLIAGLAWLLRWKV